MLAVFGVVGGLAFAAILFLRLSGGVAMMGIVYALACIGGFLIALVSMWDKVDKAEESARKAWGIINKPASAYAVVCPIYGILGTFGKFEEANESARENGGKVVKLIAVE